ncbi:MAG: hypothetical protein HXX17_08000 [Geobacteraceae bacterium]|nr:hypothetical protein [Geobacteraceae bacterium]
MLQKPEPALVNRVGRYIRVRELEQFNAAGEASCRGCAHDHNYNDPTQEDAQKRCRRLKERAGGAFPCKGSVWIEDTPEARVAYVAARLEVA